MRVSLKWLKDYVDFDLPPAELAEKLTMAGLAVENIEQQDQDIENVVVGLITEIQKHPDADKLLICQVRINDTETVQIVTGAPNVAAGQKVPVALDKSRLPGGVVIKKAKLRGVESAGMLCSAQELKLDPKFLTKEQTEGILLLDQSTPVGEDIAPALGLDDVVLVFELTPNRADCLSVLGIARDVAAVLNQPLRGPEINVPEIGGQAGDQVRLEIQDPDLCRQYAARLVKNVRVAPSPAWMQQRLRAAGIRPISNIVDVTNYVMMELGQPMHAFDFGTVAEGRVIVRRSRTGEKINSLDGVERMCDPEMLLITDPVKPIGIAGVMGGLETEVTADTSYILLESAIFDNINIRRTSKRLGLRSEASLRYEKGVNPGGALTALDRAAQLIAATGGGEVVSGVVDVNPRPAKPLVLNLRPAKVNEVLGTDIGADQVADILARLQFNLTRQEEYFEVEIPLYRGDITREIDLVEEVARIYGFDRIPTTLPRGASQGYRTLSQHLADLAKASMIEGGLAEVVTYSFTSPRVFDRLRLPETSPLRQVLPIHNPLRDEQSIMRTLVLPNLLEVIARNISRREINLAIFELGNVFLPGTKDLPDEQMTLAAAVTGEIGQSWSTGAVKLDFYFLKGVLENTLGKCGLHDLDFIPVTDHPVFHPGRTAAIKTGGQELGLIGEIHPDVLENFEINKRVYGLEINFRLVNELAAATFSYNPLPRFPAIVRDLAVIVPSDLPARELVGTITRIGGIWLRNLSLFDVYQGSPISAGYRSLAFSLTFQADDRTLTDEEVNEVFEKIRQTLVKQYDVRFRE